MLDESAVTDISWHDGMAVRIRHLLEILQRASVCEHIQVHNPDAWIRTQEVAHEVTPDEARTTGDQDIAGGIGGHV
jgi:hypothetical protein